MSKETRTKLALQLLGVGSLLMMVFQISLALGAPFGHAAWGGTYTVLPKHLRAESLFSAFLFLCSIAVFRGRAGASSQPPALLFFRIGSILLSLMFSISAVLNALSYSSWERLLMAPIAAVMAVCGWSIVRLPHQRAS